MRRVFGASECDFHNSKISPSLKNFAVIIGHAGLALSSSFPLYRGGGGGQTYRYLGLKFFIDFIKSWAALKALPLQLRSGA